MSKKSLLLAALMLMGILLVACQPEPTGLVNGDISSIRVEPIEMTLVTTPDEPAQADFIAYATMADGTEIEMDLLSWKVSNFSAGDIIFRLKSILIFISLKIKSFHVSPQCGLIKRSWSCICMLPVFALRVCQR